MGRWMATGVGLAALAAVGLAGATGQVRAGEVKEKDAARKMSVRVHGGVAHLGVGLEDVGADDLGRLKLREERGAMVSSVGEDSPAAKAGLQKGDVVLRYQGEAVQSAAHLARLVRETPAGRKVALEVSRDGEAQSLTATLVGRGGDRLTRNFHFALPENFEMELPDHFDFDMEMPDPPEPPDAPAPPSASALRRRMLLDREHLPGLLEHRREGSPSWGLTHPLLRGGPQPRLGISYQRMGEQLAGYFKASEGALLVMEVHPDTPAARGGLKAGDVILEVDGKTLEGDALRETLRKRDAGAVALTVQRNGERIELKVQLPREPEGPRRPRARVQL